MTFPNYHKEIYLEVIGILPLAMALELSNEIYILW